MLQDLAPVYLKHPIKCQEEDCSGQPQERSNKYQKGAAHFPEAAGRWFTLTSYCFPSHHTVILESLPWLSVIPWMESNEQIFILDWPKYAGLYSGKLGRKVHVKNCSSQYMLLASDNLKLMHVLRQELVWCWCLKWAVVLPFYECRSLFGEAKGYTWVLHFWSRFCFFYRNQDFHSLCQAMRFFSQPAFWKALIQEVSYGP